AQLLRLAGREFRRLGVGLLDAELTRLLVDWPPLLEGFVEYLEVAALLIGGDRLLEARPILVELLADAIDLADLALGGALCDGGCDALALELLDVAQLLHHLERDVAGSSFLIDLAAVDLLFERLGEKVERGERRPQRHRRIHARHGRGDRLRA